MKEHCSKYILREIKLPAPQYETAETEVNYVLGRRWKELFVACFNATG
jgi:hypothetical protein